MAITVEDGTGLPAAESYCTTLFVTQYLTARGRATDWSQLTSTRKEELLRDATDYIELRFSNRFSGSRNTDTQALSFPRNGEAAVPVAVQRATAEYALRALSGPLVQDPVTDERGLRLKSKSEKLGPLEEKVEYADSSANVFKPYPAADMLFKITAAPNRAYPVI